MDFEDNNINPFFISTQQKRSEWYQCVQCLSDLRVSEHKDDCAYSPEARESATRHVQTIIKSYFNTKGIQVLKGGKK